VVGEKKRIDGIITRKSKTDVKGVVGSPVVSNPHASGPSARGYAYIGRLVPLID
jgi:hypothetical protein